MSSKKIATILPLKQMHFKMETNNPTASFKDRPVSVGISKAVEWGKKNVIAASSGNAGASTAAYSARAGLKCVVCVPRSTPLSKVAQILAHGARLFLVEGSKFLQDRKRSGC